jgi:GAF domain-containing protein
VPDLRVVLYTCRWPGRTKQQKNAVAAGLHGGADMRQGARRVVREASQSTLGPSFAEMQARIDALEAELVAARERETATAEVLNVINSSPGELAPVFDAILQQAHTLCGAAFGGLLTYDGDFLRQVASHNVPAPLAELGRQPFRPGPKNRFSELIRGEPLVHVADLAEIAEAAPDEPMVQAAVGLGGVRTLLAVPLRKDGALLGIITSYRQEVRPFTDKQIALLENFASQAVIAIENARLLTETREALQQQTATAEVLQVINSSPGDLRPVFEAVLANAVGLCEAKFGTLFLCEADAFRAVATHNAPPGFAEARMRALLRPPPDAPLGWVAATKQVSQTADIRTNRSYSERDPFVVDGAELGGYRTVLSVPMLKDKELIGAINIQSPGSSALHRQTDRAG